MYQSTAEFGNLVQQDSRTFKCLLTYDKVSITKVKSIKLTGGSEAEDDFSLGSTMSQYIEVTIPDGNLLIEGKEILLQIGMDVNGLTEYIPMGYFTVGKPKKADDQITFTAYDRMMNTERTFSMDGTTTNTVAALKKIADITGVPVVTTGLTAISMKVPKGYSCREVLSYVAQLHGAFAVCNRRGQIELHTYVDSDYKVKPNRYWGNFEHNDYNFNVSKFVCFTGQDKNGKSISISSGSGARSVSFSNPFMTQTALNNILTAFKDFSYMPGALKMMGDPRLDPWDVLTVEDLSGNTYNVPVMKLEWEYDGGLTYSVEAVGLSEEETNADYKGPQTKEMERYYAQLVMIDQAMINKLDVDTANITYATIKNLSVVEENVQKINGEVGNFKELTAANFTAANAKIDVLDGNYANIKTLLSGGAGIGDLQNIHLTSQNAVIDSALIRSAVMQTVSVADLLAGTISTNKFLIASDDGGIRIQGATQQWSDTDGTVRMQAGRDAKGDFTFALFDKDGKGVLIDSTGVKKESTTMNINTSLISNNNSYAGQTPAYIVIHNTDNYAKGANAKAHAKAQHDGNFKGYSAHVYVDDTEAYQALPYNRGAWHVGVNYGGRLFGTVNNRNSVGIEMCVQAGYNYEKAFQNTVQVCKQLMKQLGIPADRVVQHYDVCAKNCPSAIRAKGDWNRFKQLIGAKTATPTVDKYYRTRKSWADSKSQIGAYKSLENAKKEWKKGYTIYDWNGKAVYPVQTSKKAVVLTGKFEAQLPIIRKGNSGVAVSVLQSVLGVTVDGRFGDDTETSLKVFQKNTGVKANGTCGIDSWKKVIEHVKANTK